MNFKAITDKIMTFLKKAFALTVLLTLFVTTSFGIAHAQDIDTDDDRQALNDKLMMLVPEETDNPNHTLSFSNPSKEEPVLLSIDGAKETEIVNPYSLPSLGIGEHTLSFTFTSAEETETTYEVSIIIKPRPPEISPPEKSEGGVLISGSATAASDIYLFIAGEKSNYREVIEAGDTGKWEYLFLEDYDSSYYTATAYVSKNGFGSSMSEPIIFTVQLENNDPVEEVAPQQDEIVFTYKALLTKEFWQNYNDNAEFIVFFVTVMFIGLFFGFVLTRLMIGSKERSLEQNLQNALLGKGAKESATDKKARREEKKLQKQKEKEEKRLEKEMKKMGKKGEGDKTPDEKKEQNEKDEKKDESKVSLLDKFRRSKDQKDDEKNKEEKPEEENNVPTSEEEVSVTPSGTRIEPIVDEETENINEDMSKDASVAGESEEVISENEENKTSESTVEDQKEKPEVTAMHVPVDEDDDEDFHVFGAEGEESEQTNSEEESDEEPVQVAGDYEGDEEAESNKAESPEESTEGNKTDDKAPPSDSKKETGDPAKDADGEESTESDSDKKKAMDKTDFLNKYKVYDPDPEGKDPLELADGERELSPEATDDEQKQEDESQVEVKVDTQETDSDQETDISGEPEEGVKDTVDQQKPEESKAPKTMAEKLVTFIRKKDEAQKSSKEETAEPEKGEEAESATDKLKLEDSDIDTRTVNILVGEGFTYVEDVKDKPEEELKEIKGIGDVSIEQIQKAKIAKTDKDEGKDKKDEKPAPTKKSKKSKGGSKARSKKKEKPTRKKKPTATRKKNNIPPQLTGGLEDVDW